MDGPTTIIKHPTITDGPNAVKVFSFDYSYWSYDTTSNKKNYADQQRVFQDLGLDILNNAFEGREEIKLTSEKRRVKVR
jgi:kinesin family protein 1